MKINFSLILIVTVISFIFACSAFLNGNMEEEKVDFFVTYLIYQLNFLTGNLVLFIFVLLGLGFVFLNYTTLTKNMFFFKRYLLSLFNAASITFIAIFSSYALLLFVAIAELNIMSVMININPNTVGLVTDADTISNRLKTLKNAPQIITSEKDRHKMLVTVAAASSGTNNLFANNILPSIPGFLVLGINEPKTSVMMLDDIVIFAGVDRKELETVSPMIANLLIRSYFHDRPIKSALNLSVVDIKDYVDFREHGINERMAGVGENDIQNEASIASTSARIEEIENLIAFNENFIEQAKIRRNPEFKECISTDPTVFCQEQRSLLDEEVKESENELKLLTEELELTQKQLVDLELLKEVYGIQEQIVEGRRGFVSREHGIFEPEDTIIIPLDNESERTITDYFTIFVHEYLHYASFITDDKTLNSSFFEEGLTEYFSRKILKVKLDTSTNLGYPLQIKIIDKITDVIHESELEDIYFAKDKERLEIVLDRAYGKDFYKENKSYFEALQYTSDQEQLLKVANLIMEKINGPELTEKDLVSSFSN